MAALPVLAIGVDAGWRGRMQRLLATRIELNWMGAHAPAQRHPSGEEPPALLLLDGDDPRVDRRPRRPRRPAPRRLYFYRQPGIDALRECLAREAHGCLGKDASPATVLHAMRAVQAGLFVVDPSLLREAFPDQDAASPPAEPTCDWAALTDRQREIVGLAARGLSNKQIARQLGISPETVKTHLHHVFERHGVHGRMALLAAHADGD
jgi:DNA-binding NarL/FixJ family response regulator